MSALVSRRRDEAFTQRGLPRKKVCPGCATPPRRWIGPPGRGSAARPGDVPDAFCGRDAAGDFASSCTAGLYAAAAGRRWIPATAGARAGNGRTADRSSLLSPPRRDDSFSNRPLRRRPEARRSTSAGTIHVVSSAAAGARYRGDPSQRSQRQSAVIDCEVKDGSASRGEDYLHEKVTPSRRKSACSRARHEPSTAQPASQGIYARTRWRMEIGF